MKDGFELPDGDDFALFMHAFLQKVPRNTAWIIHPENYPRISRSVDRILEAIRRSVPDAKHEIAYDELFGTQLVLTVTSWTFSFSNCREIGDAIALADFFETDAKTTGEICLIFGFNDARIAVASEKG